jgi:hypothetical protein
MSVTPNPMDPDAVDPHGAARRRTTSFVNPPLVALALTVHFLVCLFVGVLVTGGHRSDPPPLGGTSCPDGGLRDRGGQRVAPGGTLDVGSTPGHGPTGTDPPSPRTQGASMDFSSQFDQLNQRVTEAKAAAQAAADSRDELKQRIDRAQADLDKAASDARQRASEATSDSRGKWAQMKADAAARRDDVKAKVDKRTRQTDAKAAASDADWAEADAVDALDYAAWTVDNAELAVLDAIDARAYADDRAKLASPR